MGRVAAAALASLALVAASSGSLRAEPSILAGAASPVQTITLAFTPSSDAQRVLATGSTLARMLEVATGYRIRADVPTSYAATIEAMCAGRVDVAFLHPFAYVLAHQRCGAEVRLVSVRFGVPYYRSQIVYRADLPIRTVADLRGRRFAFVDPASASGYLFPAALLKRHGLDPQRHFSQVVFAGGHDKVVLAVYTGSVDAGATFGDEFGNDARERVIRHYPDVKERVRVLLRTDPIPADTVSFRRDLPEEVAARVALALVRIAQTAPGRETLDALYRIQAFADLDTLRTAHRVKLSSLDEFFAPIREVARLLGVNLEELVRAP
ncbi:MAG: phosphate/phosphite/phosphonate ABC transporter substrate-binding protein [Armatimonadota bacterium]|nr:phosphate/phosphite/phosphonate ABC transporter substrate-binding protein [Armatimonadota bacterium]MDR7536538.1 phosphate/phosphite/phosphonate ABC transporter substrate-binding protein [Armatimonadota bacterium]